MSRMFSISLPLAFTRGAGLGIAVTCGFSVRWAKITTVGNLFVAATVGTTTALSVGGSVEATSVGDAVRLGTSPSTGDGVKVAVGKGVEVIVGVGVAVGGRFVLVGGIVATMATCVAEGRVVEVGGIVEVGGMVEVGGLVGDDVAGAA